VLHGLAQGLALILTPHGVLMLGLGVVVGLVFGAIPGLGGTTAIALFIPLTYGMPAHDAMALAGGIMGAVAFGGSITAILLNTPGTPMSAATCFDGYPLAQQGKSGMAIGAAGLSSSLGGLCGVVILVLLVPFARELVLAFGPPEFFMMALLGLSSIAASTGGMFLRGLIAAAAGLMMAFVGYDSVSGGNRFMFGIEYLWDGIPLVPTLIGLFAIAEMIKLAIEGGTVVRTQEFGRRIVGVREGIAAVFRNWATVLRGSAIGVFIGIIPGVGGTVASFLAYSVTRQVSKHPDTFGKGEIQGVIGPEAAINAKDGGALVPTLAFGIPGSAEMAVFLGLLVLHGLDPGPLLLIQHEGVVFSLIVALTLSCILATVLGLAVTRWLSLITLVDVHILVPAVIAVSLVGAYALDNKLGDVVVAAAAGVLGYLMIRFDYPRVTMVIALVLGDLAERSFYQTMQITNGSWSVYVTRPLSAILLLLTLLSLSVPALRLALARRRGGGATSAGAST
jgi:putative tricarboxylic transport membrane protein